MKPTSLYLQRNKNMNTQVDNNTQENPTTTTSNVVLNDHQDTLSTQDFSSDEEVTVRDQWNVRTRMSELPDRFHPIGYMLLFTGDFFEMYFEIEDDHVVFVGSNDMTAQVGEKRKPSRVVLGKVKDVTPSDLFEHFDPMEFQVWEIVDDCDTEEMLISQLLDDETKEIIGYDGKAFWGNVYELPNIFVEEKKKWAAELTPTILQEFARLALDLSLSDKKNVKHV